MFSDDRFFFFFHKFKIQEDKIKDLGEVMK